MIAYCVLMYLVWFVKAPWWLFIPLIAGVIIKVIDTAINIYEEGKEDGDRAN